jgi:thioredoxin reductase
MDTTWDCIVVGAGAAGLSAALTLGRARRRTLVVDAGGQSNLPSEGVHGLLGHDGRAPAELYALGRRELAAYPSVAVRAGEVVDGRPEDAGFVLELADGTRETTRRVLLATGADYRHADVPGARERWGTSVFHCPFCHGWEHRDRPLGVLASGPGGVHRALLLRAWSDDVTLLTDGPDGLGGADRARLAAAGVAIDERRVRELRGPGTELTSVAFADGTERPLGGLLAAVTLHQRGALAERLGARLADPGVVAAGAIDVDAMAATSVAGVSAAGDAAEQRPAIANAVATGATAAAMLVAGLMTEVADAAPAGAGVGA